MINPIGSDPTLTSTTQLKPHLWFDTSFATEFQTAAKTAAPVSKPADPAAASPAISTAAATPAAVSNTGRDTLAPGEPPPALYPSWMPDGQLDFDPAHAAANILYESDYICNPKTFDVAAEQAKYKGMSDSQVMGIEVPMETKFLSRCDQVMAAGGPNIDAAGRPINWVTFYQQVDAGL